MATFKDLIKSGKVQAAYLHRGAILDEIYKNVLSIEKLDQETPNVRTFDRLETNANKSLEELKLAKRELYILLEQANHDIKDDEEYIADQKLVLDNEFALLNAIEDYIQLLHSKEIVYPPEVKPEIGLCDLSAILSNLVTSQNKLAEAQDKNAQAQDKNAQAQDKMINTLDKNLSAVVKSYESSSKSGPKPTQPKFKLRLW